MFIVWKTWKSLWYYFRICFQKKWNCQNFVISVAKFLACPFCKLYLLNRDFPLSIPVCLIQLEFRQVSKSIIYAGNCQILYTKGRLKSVCNRTCLDDQKEKYFLKLFLGLVCQIRLIVDLWNLYSQFVLLTVKIIYVYCDYPLVQAT